MKTFLRRVLPLLLLGTLSLSSCVATHRPYPRPYGYYRYGRPLPPPPPRPGYYRY